MGSWVLIAVALAVGYVLGRVRPVHTWRGLDPTIPTRRDFDLRHWRDRT